MKRWKLALHSPHLGLLASPHLEPGKLSTIRVLRNTGEGQRRFSVLAYTIVNVAKAHVAGVVEEHLALCDYEMAKRTAIVTGSSRGM